MMTNTEFLTLAEHIFNQVENQADQWFNDLDIDLDLNRNGSVLTITFANQRQIILNSQAPLQEMWLACPDGAWHYQYQNQEWLDTRTGTRLASHLSELFSQYTGQTLQLTI